MNNYPEFAHIGFKILCVLWGNSVLNRMDEYILIQRTRTR
jgi:hypothetical protein